MPGEVVVTPSGTLRGQVADGIAEFRGIPYGTAERFRPAIAAAPWTGERDATQFGPIAHQPNSMLTGPKLPAMSEDCLSLNVWAPVDAEAAPVMVWFHGGGFTTGMGSIPWYHGTHLARRGVVVVTINYRLGPLGFLHLAALWGDEWDGAANAGLLDQALALGWVAEHISAFGGDPLQVTIFGESAGGMSVGTHLGLPASRGRFHRAIAQSGAAANVHDPDAAVQIAEEVIAALDVDRSDPRGLLDVPPEAFSDVQTRVGAERRAFLALPFSPTVDGTTLPIQPIDALASDVPLLIGTTEEEMRLFSIVAAATGAGQGELDEARLVRRVGRALERASDAPGDPTDAVAVYRRRLGASASPSEVFDAVGTDVVFRVPAIRLAQARAADAPAFMYLFTHRTSSFDGMLGSGHATEIPYVFDNLDQPGTTFMIGDVTPERRALASSMADAWVAFASSGDPTTAALGPWPAYEPRRRATMRLDIDSAVVDDPHGDERRLWTG